MATTTNYGWTTPDDTALVKDGAAAIRTLGSSVDTTTKALNPETTLGDIAYRSSTANVKTRLGIGTTNQVLTVVGGVPAWATPAGSGNGLTFINKYEPSAVSTQNMNDIFSSTYKYYKIVWSVVMSDAAELQFRLRVSGSDATTNYNISQLQVQSGGTVAGSVETAIGAIPASYGATSGIKSGEMIVFNPFTATKTGINYQHYSENARSGTTGGLHTDATSYTGCSFYPATGTITGEISVYGFNRS
jgi:hypothetical protein